MPSYLITGTSRGLGLAFATKLLEDPENVVVATARNTSAPGLAALAAKTPAGRLHLVTLDVSKEDAFPPAVAAADALLPNGLDYLIANAAVDYQTFKTLGNDVDFNKFQEELFVNVISPAITLRAFTPLLNKGTAKKVLFMGSEMGSLTASEHVPLLGDTYSVGKAALHMLVRKYGAALKVQGSDIILLNVFPGLVPATELGAGVASYFKKYAPDYPLISLEDSITGTLKVLHTATKEDHTKFLNWKHEPVAW